MAKYKRHYTYVPVQEAGKYSVKDCNAFSIYNAGNTVMTVDRLIPVEPLGMYRGEDSHPDIEEDAEIYLEFNNGASVPPASFTTPTLGTFGRFGGGNPIVIDGLSVTVKEARAIIIKTHITPVK